MSQAANLAGRLGFMTTAVGNVMAYMDELRHEYPND